MEHTLRDDRADSAGMNTLRVAYLIFAHSDPQQLARLVSRLSDDNAAFFIHINQLSPAAVYNEAVGLLSGREDVRFVDRVRVTWGTISFVEALFSCLRAAIAAGRFDMYVLLSGQDYPLQPPRRINERLESFRGKSLIHHWRLPSEKWHWEDNGKERYLYWNLRVGRKFLPIFGPHRFSNRVMDKVWNFLAARVQLTRKFPLHLVPYGGSFWCALSDDAARYAVSFVDQHADFHKFFRGVRIPDEMYLHTIIMNSVHGVNVVNTSLHYINWSSSITPSPQFLTLEDRDGLAATDKLFARKFSIDRSPEVLDWIDETFLRNGSVARSA
jgi:hypothetical protein